MDTKEHKFIIRIDDYPTGVRDKIDNYRKFADQILNEFERYNIKLGCYENGFHTRERPNWWKTDQSKSSES